MIIKLDINVGDIVLTGKFKNKRTKVKSIGTDELGQPTINGKSILKLRIEKLMPEDKQSKKTREEALEEGFTNVRFKKLAGLLTEQENFSDDADRGGAGVREKQWRLEQALKKTLPDECAEWVRSKGPKAVAFYTKRYADSRDYNNRAANAYEATIKFVAGNPPSFWDHVNS